MNYDIDRAHFKRRIQQTPIILLPILKRATELRRRNNVKVDNLKKIIHSSDIAQQDRKQNIV